MMDSVEYGKLLAIVEAIRDDIREGREEQRAANARMDIHLADASDTRRQLDARIAANEQAIAVIVAQRDTEQRLAEDAKKQAKQGLVVGGGAGAVGLIAAVWHVIEKLAGL